VFHEVIPHVEIIVENSIAKFVVVVVVHALGDSRLVFIVLLVALYQRRCVYIVVVFVIVRI
jgi:hypothetical protein